MLQQIAKQVSVLTDGIGTALLKSKQQNELLEEKINDLQAKTAGQSKQYYLCPKLDGNRKAPNG